MCKNVFKLINKPMYEDDIVKYGFHMRTRHASMTFNNNAEIHIPIHQQNVYTLPNERFLFIKCELVGANNQYDNTIHLVLNGIVFLFDEMRYKICGTKVDRVKNVGISVTLNYPLSSYPQENNSLLTTG